ncbi:Enoyl-CoA hydratase/carnithine racemase [Pseudoxanthomonas sp. GM95]|uniref:enoyl-CoA hydratase/isomerase family protein n=1 Tax=Pseudoxanthomonas sp. GM95 TaxID=1881043 RepID=UPI0008B95E7A|nr:enoyl-CoA hydratase/isomerase family protein [Pseudoxanthomonas sp. GM95]SEK52267.1 Enoyl-CoA hydratase/carnithine racemase [Pseudoxanthomonas sp. GM95]
MLDQVKELRVERAGTTLTLTLDRADKRNALSPSLVDALLGAVQAAYHDGTELLVLRGEGKNFCAGFDLSDYAEASEGDLLLRFVHIEQLLQAVAHAPFETVALVHGRNFGAGVDLICSCDRRIASADASFMMPGLGFGLVLGTRRYAARVGAVRARSVLGDGMTFDAATAVHDGFLTQIAETDTWPALLEQLQTTTLPRLSGDAWRRLDSALLADTRDADMAALVASAAVPGIHERIRRYREGARA